METEATGAVSWTTNQTLTRDWYCTTLSVASGVTINTGGWIIHCQGLASVNGATFICPGFNASGVTGGNLSNSSTSTPTGTAGGNGGAVDTNGSTGKAGNVSSAGNGGNSAVKTGGTGGVPTAGEANLHHSVRAVLGVYNPLYGGPCLAGSGGGGGAGAATTYAGGGGGGGRRHGRASFRVCQRVVHDVGDRWQRCAWRRDECFGRRRRWWGLLHSDYRHARSVSDAKCGTRDRGGFRRWHG